jgi:anthranilate synthase component 1
VSAAAGGRGSVDALVRRLEGAPDPLELYRALSDDGRRPSTLLFETADASGAEPVRSLVLAGAALVATCRGRRVHIEASSANGEAALAHVVDRAAPRAGDAAGDRATIEERSRRHATLLFPARTSEADLAARLAAPSPLDALRAMASFEAHAHATSHAVFCGGVFAYDFVDAFEALPEAAEDPLGYPDFVFLLAESLVVIEPAAGRTTVVCAAFGSDDATLAEVAHNDGRDRLAALVERCRAAIDRRARPARGEVASAVDTLAAARRPPALPARGPDAGAQASEDVRVDMDDAAYARQVAALKEHVACGDVFQVVPSRSFSTPCPEPIEAYAALRARSPSPYMFFLAAEDHALFGASPETSVRVARGPRGELEMEIRPLAGTRRRGRTAAGELDVDLDNRREAELLLDEKERAEHMMLVDLARNDVARVCRAGTRRVERMLTVERFSHVMHLESRVTGALRPEHDALGAYASAMNMGTLVGAPKVRAAELLRVHERTKRGPYGGAIGYFTGAGELDTAIVIRSALVKDGVAHVRAGAGVVHDSDPVAEADETRRKAASVLEALRSAGARGAEASGGAPSPGTSIRGAAMPGDGPSERGCEVILVDNFDSFSWNLADAFERLGCRVRVLRNTAPARAVLDLARARAGGRGGLVVLSPGPGAPQDAGSCMDIVTAAKGVVPLLGVCLGHQAIVSEAGGVVDRADTIVHGKATRLSHDGTGPFAGVPDPLFVGRYHSLATRRIPTRLHVHAAIGDMAMAVSDPAALQVGLQFHPESILTPEGQTLLANVVAAAAERRAS